VLWAALTQIILFCRNVENFQKNAFVKEKKIVKENRKIFLQRFRKFSNFFDNGIFKINRLFDKCKINKVI
jgi:hypothetical protein